MSGVVEHVHANLLSSVRMCHKASVMNHWVTVVANSISALAPGIFNVNLTLWDAHSFQGKRTAADSALLLKLCVIFIVSWAARGACAALSMGVPDDVLEALLREALKSEEIDCAPPEEALWISYIDAPNVRWTTWSEMLRARAATKGPELIAPDGTLLLAPLSSPGLCLRHLIAAGMSSGASMLVEGRTQGASDATWRSLLSRFFTTDADPSLQWISTATSAVAGNQWLRVWLHWCGCFLRMCCEVDLEPVQ